MNYPVAKGGNTYTNCWTNGNSEIVYEPNMNLYIHIYIQCHIKTVFGHTLFTQNPTMMEADCQKIIIIWLIINLPRGICVFWKYFMKTVSFIFYKKYSWEYCCKNFFGVLIPFKWYQRIYIYIYIYTICYPQPLAYRAHDLIIEISRERWHMLHSDIELFRMFQAKPNQTGYFLFLNLSKISQPGSTCAVCCKFL